MKRLTSLVAALLVLALGLSTARAQNTRYFDINDDLAGSGVADNTANPWDTTTPSWNPNADGTGAGPGTTLTWVNGDDAVFSAGTDAAGLFYGLNIATGVTAHNVTIEEGRVLINTGLLDSGANTVTVNSGATLEVKAGSTATYGLNAAGKIVLNGGAMRNTNPGSAGTFSPTAKSYEINGTGHLKYDDGDGIFDNKVSIYSGIIRATGGTTTNGGAGTLYVDGGDQLGIGATDLDPGTPVLPSHSEFTFAKLVVDTGSYRGRNVGGVVDERFLGAVPLAVLPDAITLKNNGAIGSNAAITLNANRGITVSTGGGRVSGIGLGAITVPGPLTSDGGTTLQIDGRNLTTTSATYGRSGGGLTLSNANNVTTFANGSINIDSSVLTLNESLSLASLSGGSETASAGVGTTTGTGNASAVATGSIAVVAAKTLTVGSNNASTSFAGRVTGAGAFTKVGTGELLLNTIAATEVRVPTDPAYNGGTPIVVYSGEFTNTGGVNINGGSIKFGTSNSGFATANPVTIASGAKLNMNGINDTFGSLAGPAGATVDMNDGGAAATPGNLTFGAASGTASYSGTISGGGNLRMGNAGAGAASTAVQTLAGTNTVGTVTVSAGNTNQFSGGTLKIGTGGTTTASGAVAVTNGALIVDGTLNAASGTTVGATTGILGGTGIIASAVTNNGVVAPGDGGVGTLSLTGNFASGSASTLHIELSGATSDKLAVTGNFDLSAAGDILSVTGTGSGSSWLIGTYTGTQSGVFDTITPGYTVTYAGGNITLNSAGVPGDFNGDSKVDAADYVSLRKTNSDILNNPGLANYNTWRTNYGVGTGSGSGGGLGAGAVPEPTSIGLVLIGLAALGLGRRNRAR